MVKRGSQSAMRAIHTCAYRLNIAWGESSWNVKWWRGERGRREEEKRGRRKRRRAWRSSEAEGWRRGLKAGSISWFISTGKHKSKELRGTDLERGNEADGGAHTSPSPHGGNKKKKNRSTVRSGWRRSHLWKWKVVRSHCRAPPNSCWVLSPVRSTDRRQAPPSMQSSV